MKIESTRHKWIKGSSHYSYVHTCKRAEAHPTCCKAQQNLVPSYSKTVGHSIGMIERPTVLDKDGSRSYLLYLQTKTVCDPDQIAHLSFKCTSCSPSQYMVLITHCENTPIQIYWKFYNKKGKFSDKKIWYFSFVCSKHRLWVLVRTASARRF